MRHPRLRGGATALLLLAVILRVWDFGNPVIHVDEQYYLLVGDRMLHGAVPYIDIWDRKPIGLFGLYALIRLLPGDGILAYQVAACIAAALTAVAVRAAALRLGAQDRGAIAGGAIYLIGLSLLGGRGGQSPVFYNLAVMLAALAMLGIPARAMAGRQARIVWGGAIACLLAGVAIQMKYTPAVEGAFFGCAFLWGHATSGARWPARVGAALLFLACGLAPTLAAAAWYWTRGGFDAWLFANFASILLRAGYPADQIAMRLLGIAAQLAPLILCAAFTWRRRSRTGVQGQVALLAFGWAITALLGFLAIGTFFDHYALPLLMPLAVVAAPTLGQSTRAMVATLGLALTLFMVERLSQPDDEAGARAVAEVVRRNAGGTCPYVFIGDTITYHLAEVCLPTPYAFPNLLAYATERGATGIDEAAEVRRILSRRPGVIVTSTRRLSIWNPGSVHAVKAALATDYRPVFFAPRASWRTVVYLRRDLRFTR